MMLYFKLWNLPHCFFAVLCRALWIYIIHTYVHTVVWAPFRRVCPWAKWSIKPRYVMPGYYRRTWNSYLEIPIYFCPTIIFFMVSILPWGKSFAENTSPKHDYFPQAIIQSTHLPGLYGGWEQRFQSWPPDHYHVLESGGSLAPWNSPAWQPPTG